MRCGFRGPPPSSAISSASCGVTRRSASEDPIMARKRRRTVLLIDVTRPRALDHMVGMLPGNGKGIVGAEGVDDDDLVGPGDRRQGVADIPCFVLGDDGDREFRHAASVLGGRVGQVGRVGRVGRVGAPAYARRGRANPGEVSASDRRGWGRRGWKKSRQPHLPHPPYRHCCCDLALPPVWTFEPAPAVVRPPVPPLRGTY